MPVLTAWQMKATSTIQAVEDPRVSRRFASSHPVSKALENHWVGRSFRLIPFHPVAENGSLAVAWRAPNGILQGTTRMPRIRLVDTTVRALQPPARGQVNYIDVTLPGFSLRVAAGGAKRWIVTYHRGGRVRRVTFGRYPL